jgi:hypothetical protein
MIQISHALLDDLISYIEDVELTLEHEFNSCRSLSQLIADDDMPDIYNKLLELKPKFDEEDECDASEFDLY